MVTEVKFYGVSRVFLPTVTARPPLIDRGVLNVFVAVFTFLWAY